MILRLKIIDSNIYLYDNYKSINGNLEMSCKYVINNFCAFKTILRNFQLIIWKIEFTSARYLCLVGINSKSNLISRHSKYFRGFKFLL